MVRESGWVDGRTANVVGEVGFSSRHGGDGVLLNERWSIRLDDGFV